ncbi:MAG: PAS domain-containing protein [Bacteroidales bacterium]|nr:PAS domain-containing protein [Bacteroidales bacterium]MCF8455913.1 PAS domain-containing protein [Bacteroidales bacterium]
MSEFTNTQEKRLAKLHEVSTLLLKTGNARSFILENKDFIPTVIPDDFIKLFDVLIQEGQKVEDLKPLSNKILNIFHNAIDSYQRPEIPPNSFLAILEQNNAAMNEVLNKIRPVFKAFVKDQKDEQITSDLILLFEELNMFAKHYIIKENVLFPILEKTWPDYRCIQIMWSFHDDIRRNIKSILDQLKNGVDDFQLFSRKVGDVFFNMLAIKFREEKILFPYILSTVSEEHLTKMNREGQEIGYPFIQPTETIEHKEQPTDVTDKVNLSTGLLTIDQIKLIFNHLPVDITYVDEQDKVRYFSSPKKRIFHRTTAIIDREVKNCHPPESVHVVEKIIESFRNGEKDQANFWIKMKGEYILIQYFAVRDENRNYKGVIEVTQEISEIKAIEGEKRLLDW